MMLYENVKTAAVALLAATKRHDEAFHALNAAEAAHEEAFDVYAEASKVVHDLLKAVTRTALDRAVVGYAGDFVAAHDEMAAALERMTVTAAEVTKANDEYCASSEAKSDALDAFRAAARSA